VPSSTLLDHVERYAAAAGRFADAIADADLKARLPTCPGWTVYDLVCHLGNVHAWAATIVETGRAAPDQFDQPPSRRPRTVTEWYVGRAEDLYEVLRSADPGRPCWNFAFGTGVAAFWPRRQLHETTVHGLDLDAATGTTDTVVDPDVAADGVDEVLTVFLHRMHERGHPADLRGPICLGCEDVDRAWTVSPRPPVKGPQAGVPVQPRGSAKESAPPLPEGPPVVVDRRHPRADQVTGPAATLYKVLWKRADNTGLHVVGDADRVDAFLGSRLAP
jgi:uncharacterized protein (TIGR03083 family)